MIMTQTVMVNLGVSSPGFEGSVLKGQVRMQLRLLV